MEAMAAESIVAADWELEGFLTKVRWPIKVEGGYSDIDAIGIATNGKVRLAECKVRMGPRVVYVLGKHVDFIDWLGDWAAASITSRGSGKNNRRGYQRWLTPSRSRCGFVRTSG